MSAASPELVFDGFSIQPSGMNDGLSRFRLSPTQAALLINATTRGDYVTQRPGWDRIMTVLPSGTGYFQHGGVFKTDGGRVFILAVVGGRIFRVDPVDKTVLEITIPGDRNPSTLTRGWSVQGEQFWIYNDGQTKPFIWTGGSARRAGKGEILPGTVIAYVQGRLWYALPDSKSFRATDLVGSDSGTAAYNYRDSILKETENTFLNEGGDFRVPAEAGEIVAMRAPTILDTSQGQGPLLVICENDAFSVNTPVDRNIWKDVQYPIQTASLMGRGGWSQQCTVNINGDLWFRSRVNGEADGLSSYLIARREFRDLGNVPQSFEVSNALSFDQSNLLVYGSGAVYDNRFFSTFSPGYSSAGTYHRGLIALDLSPMNSIQTKAPPVYDGVWTGLNILTLIPTPIGLYALVLAGNGNIDLWRLTKTSLWDNGGPITWSHIPRALFSETSANGTPGRTLKRLETMDLEYDRLTNETDFTISFAPDSYPCLTQWANWTECVKGCESTPPCPLDLSFQTGYMPRKRLPEPPDENPVMPGRPLRNFYTLTLRTDITGPARLLGLRVGATLQQEPKYEANICASPVCIPIKCCNGLGGPGGVGGNLFTYTAHGSGGTQYYGYDYGFQEYYGPGYDYEAPVGDTEEPKPPLPKPPPTPPPVPPPGVPTGPFDIPVVNGWQAELGFNVSYVSGYGITKVSDDIAADGMTQEQADFWKTLLINEILESDPAHPPIDQLVFAWDWVDPYSNYIDDFDAKFLTGDPVPHEGDPIFSPGAFWRLDAFYKQL